ncbi:hypothetical protein, conserved [Eimeria necatrix]|uniref:Protein kinase domain-containing protein n=1 Tax=Eimeria necatrix TaxID=51315 RepID=U6MK95_9EIME|nr:hypothetical protein, conserved [Eimeria necatrix]CDJ62045.1 hypothetical protein, conserved [Eimeria necatrix]
MEPYYEQWSVPEGPGKEPEGVGVSAVGLEGEDMQLLDEEPSTAASGAVLLPSAQRARRLWNYLAVGGLAVPTIVLFMYLMSAFAKTKQQLSWESVVKPQAGLPAPPAQWQVPPVHPPEERESVTNQLVRGVLADVSSQLVQGGHIEPEGDAQTAMEAVAKALSNGQSEDLLGMTIRLSQVTEVGSGEQLQEPRDFVVTRFIDQGYQSVLLAVQDRETEETSAMRINFLPADLENLALTTAKASVSPQMVRVAQASLGISGSTPLAAAAQEKGIAPTRFMARIDGFPKILRHKGLSVMSAVEITENVEVSLQDALDALDLPPTGTKAYIARSVLKTVLHMQRAGWSHNGLNCRSFGVQEDGSVLLLGLQSSVPFGEVIPDNVGISPLTTEPELLASLWCYEDCKGLAQANAKSDMWSLGIVLHQILMDGELPFGLSEIPSDESAIPHVVQLREHTDIDEMLTKMEGSGVSRRWRELVVRLLETDRSKRISAEEVAAEYTDLLNGATAQQVLDREDFLRLFKMENPDFVGLEAELAESPAARGDLQQQASLPSPPEADGSGLASLTIYSPQREAAPAEDFPPVPMRWRPPERSLGLPPRQPPFMNGYSPLDRLELSLAGVDSGPQSFLRLQRDRVNEFVPVPSPRGPEALQAAAPGPRSSRLGGAAAQREASGQPSAAAEPAAAAAAAAAGRLLQREAPPGSRRRGGASPTAPTPTHDKTASPSVSSPVPSSSSSSSSSPSSSPSHSAPSSPRRLPPEHQPAAEPAGLPAASAAAAPAAAVSSSFTPSPAGSSSPRSESSSPLPTAAAAGWPAAAEPEAAATRSEARSSPSRSSPTTANGAAARVPLGLGHALLEMSRTRTPSESSSSDIQNGAPPRVQVTSRFWNPASEAQSKEEEDNSEN